MVVLMSSMFFFFFLKSPSVQCMYAQSALRIELGQWRPFESNK